jgi:hypothetical protein
MPIESPINSDNSPVLGLLFIAFGLLIGFAGVLYAVGGPVPDARSHYDNMQFECQAAALSVLEIMALRAF